MDAAERWLRENDPEYAKKKEIQRKKNQYKKKYYRGLRNQRVRGNPNKAFSYRDVQK